MASASSSSTQVKRSNFDEFVNSFSRFLEKFVDTGYMDPSTHAIMLSALTASKLSLERGETNLCPETCQQFIIYSNPQLASIMSNPNDTNVESFDEYSGRVSFQSVALYIFPSFAKPGEVNKYYHVTESCKSILSSMVSFFLKLHSMRLSVRSFELSNLVYCGDKVKFQGLQFVELKDEKDSFKLLYNLMENLVNNYKGRDYEIPDLLEDLLSRIRNHIDSENSHRGFSRLEGLLTNHIALIPYDHSHWIAVMDMEGREEYGSESELGVMGDVFNYKNYIGQLHVDIVEYIRKYSGKDKFLNIMVFVHNEYLSFLELTHQSGGSVSEELPGIHNLPIQVGCINVDEYRNSFKSSKNEVVELGWAESFVCDMIFSALDAHGLMFELKKELEALTPKGRKKRCLEISQQLNHLKFIISARPAPQPVYAKLGEESEWQIVRRKKHTRQTSNRTRRVARV